MDVSGIVPAASGNLAVLAPYLQGDEPLYVPRDLALVDLEVDGKYFKCLVWADPTDICAGAGRDRCLWNFVKLADASDDAIVSFARRYGPLGLCDHRLPFGHSDDCHMEYRSQHGVPPFYRSSWRPGNQQGAFGDVEHVLRPAPGPAQSIVESIADWRTYARRIRALLDVLATLQQGKLGDEDDWRTVEQWHAQLSDCPELADLATRKRQMAEQRWGADVHSAHQVRWWLAAQCLLGDLSPSVMLDWTPGLSTPRLTLSMSAGGLFSLVMLQFIAVATSPSGVYQCDMCRSAYTPEKRRPRSGFAHYCPDCSQGARLASKRHYFSTRKDSRVAGGCAAISAVSGQPCANRPTRGSRYCAIHTRRQTG